MVTTFGTIRMEQNYSVRRWDIILEPFQKCPDKNMKSTRLELESATKEIHGRAAVGDVTTMKQEVNAATMGILVVRIATKTKK